MAKNPHQLVNKAERTERQIKAYNMSLTGMSQRAIGAELGCSHTEVGRLIMDEIAEKVEVPREAVRIKMLDEIDRMILQCEAILAADIYIVNHGKVIKDDEGNPLIDHEAKLKVMDRLLRMLERRAKLLGVDMPVLVEQTHRTVTRMDDSIASLIAEMDAKAEAERARIDTAAE